MNATISKKKIGKSVLSLVLVMLMIFSAVPFGAAAATVVPPNTPIETKPSHNSVPDLTVGTSADYPADGQPGYAQVTKSAEWTNPTLKTEAEVTFEAFGSPFDAKGVDVVLVIDSSGSMANPQGNLSAWQEPGQRIYEAIQAGQAFVDMMLDKQGVFESKNKVALVDFANSAYSRTYGGVSDKAALKTWIGNIRNANQQSPNGYNTSSGTDYNAALTAAYNLVDANLKALANTGESRAQYVVFMTDGGPNSYNYEQIAKDLKDKATVIGVGFQVGDTELNTLRADVVTKRETPVDGEAYWLINAPKDKPTSEIMNAFATIAAGLVEAGTDAKVVDKINTDAFTLDTSKKIMIQEGTNTRREPKTGEVTVNGNEITWNLGTLSAVHKFLIIPVVMNNKYNDGQTYILETNEGDAVITYKNFEENDCKQTVKSPELARPNTAVQVVYYKVNDEGHALNSGMGVIPAGNNDVFYQTNVPVGGKTIAAGTGNFSTVTDENIQGYDGKRYKRYGISDYDTYSTNNVAFTVADLKTTYKVYVGMVEVTEAQLTINKTYSPDKPSTVKSASFTFTNATTGDVKTWDGSGTIALSPDEVYNVVEVAPKGYLNVQNFQIKYDSKTDNIVLTGNDGNVSVTKGATTQGFTLNIKNNHDPKETVKGNYTVKYFLDNVEQTKDQVYKEKDIWIYSDDVTVDKSDVNITNKYGNTYVCESPATVPSTVKSGDVIEVRYKQNDQKHDIKYIVNYHKDNQTETVVVEKKNVWVGEKDLLLEPFKTFPGYVIKTTTPGNLVPGTSKITNGTVIDIYLEKDPTATQDIAYTIIYEDADGNRTSVPGNKTVHVTESSAQVKMTEIDFNKFPGQTVSGVTIDGTSVATYPIVIKKDAANEIVVKFEANKPTTETIVYTIEYYEYDPETEANVSTPIIETATVEVPAGQGTTPVLSSNIKSDKFPNQKITEIKIGGSTVQLPQNVANGTTIQVYFGLDSSKVKVGTYIVHYLKDGVLADTETVLKKIPAGDTKISVDTGDFKTTGKYPGYDFVDVVPGFGSRISVGGIVEVNYAANTSYTKDVTFKYDVYIGTDENGYAKYKTETTVISVWEGQDYVEVTPGVTTDVNGKIVIPTDLSVGNNDYKVKPGTVILNKDGTNAVYYELYASGIMVDLNGLVTLNSGRHSAGLFTFVGTVKDTASFGGLSIVGLTRSNGRIDFTVSGPVPIAILGKDIEFTIAQNPLSPGVVSYRLDQTVYNVTIRFYQNPAGELYVTVPVAPSKLEFYNTKK